MSTNIKYTNDGKKVAIIGNLNSQETIVQEIFIVGENEIPSGENFVVKSLHDAPAISWREAEIKRVKEYNERLISNLETENKQYESQLQKQRERFKQETKILSDKFKFIAAAVKNADEKSFETLLAFLEGKIKWLVINDTYAPRIIQFNQLVEKYSDSDYWSGINLISLFGKDDGSLQYRVFDYYNGYKSFNDVIPFETEEEAIAKLAEVINACKEFKTEMVIEAKKYNIVLDPEKLKTMIDKQIAVANENIKKQQEIIDNQRAKLEQLTNGIIEQPSNRK